jgi:hypothetical protein
MSDIRNPTEIAPSRVERRVKRLNERRESDNPLWASAGEKVLSQLAFAASWEKALEAARKEVT